MRAVHGMFSDEVDLLEVAAAIQTFLTANPKGKREYSRAFRADARKREHLRDYIECFGL